jgi:predicted esterase
MKGAWLVVALAGLTACRHADRTSAGVTLAPASDPRLVLAPDASAPDAGDASEARDAGEAGPAPLAPLPGFFEALPVPGRNDAWLSLPTNTITKRPVVVVIHGMGDRPDWQCGGWRRATGEHAFVLCPRGTFDKAESTKDDWRYTHRPGGKPLLDHIDAALHELVARYPAYVDPEHPLLVGFSLGAIEILGLAAQDPQRFPRIALVEGATGAWPASRIDAYRGGGGVRVLFAAGQRGNEAAMKGTARQLTAKGLDARVVFAPVGHTFDPPLEDAIHDVLPWFTAGDGRW